MVAVRKLNLRFHFNDVVPQFINDVAPRLINDVAPRLINDVVPRLINDVVPRLINDVVPQFINDVVPRLINDVAPRLINDVVPRLVRGIYTHRTSKFESVIARSVFRDEAILKMMIKPWIAAPLKNGARNDSKLASSLAMDLWFYFSIREFIFSSQIKISML